MLKDYITVLKSKIKSEDSKVSFTDLLNFKYDSQEVDKDIRHLLKTGEFKPAYENIVRAFLKPEIENCQWQISDDNYLLEVHPHGSMSEDDLTRTPQEMDRLLDWVGYPPEKRKFWFEYYVHPKFGRQKTPPLLRLQNADKKVSMTPFGLTIDAFYSTYTEIHELMHGVQGKYVHSADDDKYYFRRCELLYQGMSGDEAKEIQNKENPEYKKISYCNRCFKEMQANSAATCYMMLQAIKTGDEKIISAVEKRLLNESASMSGALMNDHLGLAYFEYPATKKIIAEIKQGKCDYLLNKDGLLNWPELYKYTKDKVDEMGYSRDDMYASLETAKMLQSIRAEHKDDKTEFLNAVEQEASKVEHPHNKIFKDFVDAQRNFNFDDSKNLHRFYHRMGAESLRETCLEKADVKTVPHIDEYRKIYAEAKAKSVSAKQNLSQILNREGNGR